MTRLLRRVAALAVAYALALQVLLAGVVAATHAGFDPFAATCASDAAGGRPDPLPQRRGGDCDACTIACGGAPPALSPSGAALRSPFLPDPAQPPASWAEMLPPPAKHQPHASRAPPIRG